MDFDLPESAEFDGPVCEQLLRAFQNWEVRNTEPTGPLNTDSLARLQLPIAEEHFAAMNTPLPIDVWVH